LISLWSLILDAAKIIKASKYVTALTGAGVSVESGIRSFRGPGGLWTEKGEPPMDGYQKFLSDPKKHWESALTGFIESGLKMAEAKPNAGHYAFAELEQMGIIRYLITQNIDGLHSMAGTKKLGEIHGNALKLRCMDCLSRFPRKDIILTNLPPRCPQCGGIIKGDTVMFGEPIPVDVLKRCQEEMNRSDCMIVAGTSAVVYPAAGLPLTLKRRGGKIIEVNPMETDLTAICDVSIREKSGIAIPTLLETLKKF
jgi:NAD-dependent deacetylase